MSQPTKPDSSSTESSSRPSPVAAPGPDSRRRPSPGKTFPLKVGELYAPQGFQPTSEVVVTVHFHGATWAAEQAFWKARAPGILVTVIEPGLSAAYSKPFSEDTSLFRSILEDAVGTLQAQGLAPGDASLAAIRVSSFSAGYGAVRALLRQEEYRDLIRSLLLCDSLHTGFVGDPSKRLVDKRDLAPFENFAKLAAEGEKTFLLTHTQIMPPTYASTTETADDLLQAIGASRQSASPEEPMPEGVKVLTRANKGNFHLWGCAGTTGPDHMRQLYALSFWLARLPG